MRGAAAGEPALQVFVIGMNGSGTTMLADCLARHPKLWMFPFETRVIPHFLERAQRFGHLDDASSRRDLALAIGRTKPFWHAAGKRPLSAPDSVLAEARTAAEVFDAIFVWLAGQAGKRGWIEKSPVNTLHVERLAAAFPNARFLHIIRDGRDAAQSFHRRWGYDPEHTIWRWKNMIRSARAAAARLPSARCLELRYEALTEAPEAELRRVCEFLGIDYLPSLQDSSMRHMGPAGGASAGRLMANSGKWRTYFDAAQTRRLEAVAGQELAALGYAVQLQGDEELSALRRRWLRARDAAARSAAFLRDFGWRGLPMLLRLAGTTLQLRGSRRI